VGTNGIITTVAGNGTNGSSGDGGAATNAEFNDPCGVAVDGFGNLYIADAGNDCIREVGTNGIITTVAGNGTFGYSGDGGAATNAELGGPNGVAVDGSGNLFIADYNNDCIREVGTNDIITTAAGNGTAGYSGDSGWATNAELNHPEGVVVDGYGNLYIADFGNNRIREVGTNGIITTVAGNGTNGYSGDGGAATNAELHSPNGVTVDRYGNLYIADAGNERIREVGTNGIITTVAGNGVAGYSGDGGVATNAELNNPWGVAVDGFGNLFTADNENQRIRKVGTNGIITTVAGNGKNGDSGDGGAATNAELWYPASVAVDGFGNLFFADQFYDIIREVGTNGIITRVAGHGVSGYYGDGGAATNAELSSPSGVAVDGFGNLYIADTGNYRIREVVYPGTNLVLQDVATCNAGSYNVVVTSPYGSVTSSVVTLTVVKMTPVVTWTNPLPIIYGAALSSSQLNAAAGVPGSLAYNPTNGAVLDAGTNTLSVVFTPTDTVDYCGVTDCVSLVVSPAPLTVTASNATWFVGQTMPVLTGTIAGLTNGDSITAAFGSAATTNSLPGQYPIVPNLVDPNDLETNYTVTLVNGTLTLATVSPFNLAHFGFASSNAFQIQFTNTPGATFSLWTSTNLCNWTQIGTATENSPGVYEASDSSATNCGVRFYQLRWP
jgi:sugar lactone lactonase YvrE